MTTILIIASVLIVTFIIKAIIKRDTSEDGSMNKSVSWEYIKSNYLSNKDDIIKQLPKCNCGMDSDKLQWFKFRSSNDSWRHLAGREGFYSKCPDCKIVVVDITTLMN
jgi:hypothetical protein